MIVFLVIGLMIRYWKVLVFCLKIGWMVGFDGVGGVVEE